MGTGYHASRGGSTAKPIIDLEMVHRKVHLPVPRAKTRTFANLTQMLISPQRLHPSEVGTLAMRRFLITRTQNRGYSISGVHFQLPACNGPPMNREVRTTCEHPEITLSSCAMLQSDRGVLT